MSKGLKRFFIICAIVVGAGILFSLAGFLTGGLNFLDKMSERYTWLRAGHADMEYINISDAGEFDSISVKGGIDVTVAGSTETGSRGIRYDRNVGVPEYSVKGGVLTVDASKLNDGVVVNLSSDDDTPEIVISVPDERMKKLDVTSDYGDVDVSRVTLEEMSITTEDGDIDLHDVDCSSMTLASDYGDIDLEKVTSDKITASTQDGDIDMNNVTCGSTVLTSGYGNIEGENIKSSGLSVKSQQGDVDLQGEFSGTTDVYLACGDVELRTSMARDLYTIDAQAKSGEIGIGSGHHDWDDDDDEDDRHGQHESHEGRISTGSGQNILKIVNDLGDIDISFGK